MSRRPRLATVLIILAILAIIAIIAVLATPPVATKISSPHWDNIYPSWHIFITHIIDNNCTDSLANYRENRISHPQLGYDAMGCILNEFPEFRKAEIAAAAVVLGLAPAVLGQLGPSYADTAVLAYRRPVLAVLLAAGSPAVKLMHVNDHTEFFDPLKSEPKWELDDKSFAFPGLVSFFEYLFALVAIGNNAHLMYQLGVWAVCSIAPSLTTLPGIWYASVMLLHLGGWLTIRMHSTLSENKSQDSKRRALKDWFKSEGRPLPMGPKLKVKTEEFTFAAFTSCIYVLCIIQALYGTWVLSSLVFIPAAEAVGAVLRLMLSTLLCRGILIFEMSVRWRSPADKPIGSDSGVVSVVSVRGSQQCVRDVSSV